MTEDPKKARPRLRLAKSRADAPARDGSAEREPWMRGIRNTRLDERRRAQPEAQLDLALTTEQVALREALRSCAETARAAAAARGSSAGLAAEAWTALGVRGWLALGVGEARFGLGRGLLELTLAAYEVGRAALPLPFRSAAVLGLGAIARLATEAQRDRWLGELGSGRKCYVLAHFESAPKAAPEPSDVALRALRSDDGFVLHGKKQGVEFAASADAFLVTARVGSATRLGQGISLFRVPARRAGLRIAAGPSAHPFELAELHFDGVRVPARDLVGIEGSVGKVLNALIWRRLVSLAAEAAGGARGALELATQHLLQRQQWERPLASFQALQHALADSLVDADAAELSCFETASRYDNQSRFATGALRTALIACEAYRRNAARALQLVGGAGYLGASALPEHLRRAEAIAALFGGLADLRHQIALRSRI
jgi:alkylation response protein AidB-like acyl-CoA dehydrogenase